MTQHLQRIVESKAFQRFIIGVILVAAVAVGLETSGRIRAQYSPLLRTIDAIVLRHHDHAQPLHWRDHEKHERNAARGRVGRPRPTPEQFGKVTVADEIKQLEHQIDSLKEALQAVLHRVENELRPRRPPGDLQAEREPADMAKK